MVGLEMVWIVVGGLIWRGRWGRGEGGGVGEESDEEGFGGGLVVGGWGVVYT